MLSDLAFRISAQGAYAREFGALRKEVAALDAGLSTIGRTARISALTISAFGRAFVAGIGARAILGLVRGIRSVVEETRTGIDSINGMITTDMLPGLNATAIAFKKIETVIAGTLGFLASKLGELLMMVGLVDRQAAAMANKYGRTDDTSVADSLKDLQTALAAKVERELGPDRVIVGGPNRFDIAGAVDVDKALQAKAQAARDSIALGAEQVSSIREVNSALDDQIAKLGMSAQQQRVFDELQAAGVTATSAAGQAIAAKVETLFAYEDALKRSNEQLQQFQALAGSALNSFTGALQQGKSIAEAFRDSWLSALSSIISKINEAAAAAFATQLFGGPGAVGGFGNILGGIGGLLGFATGGSFKVGGSGGPDSQFVPLALSPGEIVNVSKGEGSSGRASPVQVVVKVDANPYFDARVAQVSAPGAQRAAVSAVGAYDKATRRSRELAG